VNNRCICFPIVNAVLLLRAVSTDAALVLVEGTVWPSLAAIRPDCIEKTGVRWKVRHVLELEYTGVA
jgi:hypothetical protein